MYRGGMPVSGKSGTQERILSAAAGLFAQFGYNGTTTRTIASAAEVNEVTIYRHYPRKRDLYLAVLGAELQKVSLRGDLLAQVADSPDGRTALACTFKLIAVTLSQNRELLRLLQFTTLEMSDECDSILRHYLGELVEVVSHYLDPWLACGEIRCDNAKTVTLAMVSIVVSHHALHRIFSELSAGPDPMFDSYFALCTT